LQKGGGVQGGRVRGLLPNDKLEGLSHLRGKGGLGVSKRAFVEAEGSWLGSTDACRHRKKGQETNEREIFGLQLLGGFGVLRGGASVEF